jgi:hypothetical protein
MTTTISATTFAGTTEVSLSLEPQWDSTSIEVTLTVPGPQGPKGDPGAVGPAGPLPDTTTLALDAGYF